MATYDQRIRQYQREITRLGKDYGTQKLSRTVNRLIGDANIARKVDSQELYQAMRRGPQGIQAYLRANTQFFKSVISYGVKAGKLAYGEIAELNDDIEALNKKVSGLQQKVVRLTAQNRKNAAVVRKAKTWQRKASTLDAIADVAKNYVVSTGPTPSRADINYLKRL